MNCNDFFDFDSLNMFVEFDKPLYSIVAKRKTAKLVYMSPKQYIYKIAQGFGGLSYDDVVDSGAVVHSNVDKYAEAMKSGAKFPIGYYTKDGDQQEGRHRALAAMKLGCDKIPVIQFMKISDKEFSNVVNRLKDKSFDELDAMFKEIGFQNGITRLGYNDLQRYVEYNLSEGYDDVGVEYTKENKPKLYDLKDTSVNRKFKNFTIVNNKYNQNTGLLGNVIAYNNEDGTEVGNASYGYDYEGGPLKASIDVRSDMRRLGIGSEMYKFIEEITGEKLSPEPKHSESAEKLWNQPNREFGLKEVKNIVREVLEEALDLDYKKWKRKNVTLRGIGDIGEENSAGARFGSGLYTAFLGNRQMAREYGKVYFVVGAIPNNPKIFSDTNQAEIWLQYNLYKYEGEEYPDPRRFHKEGKTIEGEMQKLGYDGLVINGREMVNYTPGDGIMYFDNENHLIDYYEYNIKGKNL